LSVNHGLDLVGLGAHQKLAFDTSPRSARR
jgi:hypothetical protein